MTLDVPLWAPGHSAAPGPSPAEMRQTVTSCVPRRLHRRAAGDDPVGLAQPRPRRDLPGDRDGHHAAVGGRSSGRPRSDVGRYAGGRPVRLGPVSRRGPDRGAASRPVRAALGPASPRAGGDRSAQRSSTSSMPTDSRSRPSGTSRALLGPAAAALQGGLDPAEARRVHPQPSARRPPPRRPAAPPCELEADDRAEGRHLPERPGHARGRRAGSGGAPAPRRGAPVHRRAISAALAHARSQRSGNVRSPRRAIHASIGPGIAAAEDPVAR